MEGNGSKRNGKNRHGMKGNGKHRKGMEGNETKWNQINRSEMELN
jgi:hypothetical protein